jgi:hypothetical protein
MPAAAVKTLRRIAIVLLIGLPAATTAADKTDVVVMGNGDRITGEIKELSYGQLTFKTDDIGTIYIEWERIASITTLQVLQIELVDGRRLFGTLPAPGPKAGWITLMNSQYGEPPTPVDLLIYDIVRVATVQSSDKWYKRLKGSFSLGYSYTQANELNVLNVSADVGSRDRVRRWEITLDTQVTSQNNDPSSQRATLLGTIERFLPNRYYAETTLEFDRNEELGLNLRSLVGGTFGRYLIQTRNSEWRGGAGLAASTEKEVDGTRKDSLEAQITTSVNMFRLSHPKTDFNATLTVLPSLTESGRVRSEFSLKARYEIIYDLFFQLSVYDSYDNRPAEGAPNNDWGLTTSIGYTF